MHISSFTRLLVNLSTRLLVNLSTRLLVNLSTRLLVNLSTLFYNNTSFSSLSGRMTRVHNEYAVKIFCIFHSSSVNGEEF